MTKDLSSAGKDHGTIPVHLSYKIIELFSDGLYASPNKAVEELVANSFDAGAERAHVVISPDRQEPSAFVAILDDGTSMDPDGLRDHWVIGRSKKRENEDPNGRKQIGKFGIGKLATFVLGRQFTLVCRRDRKYFAVTMDYDNIPRRDGGGIQSENIELPLRKLTAAQAKGALKFLEKDAKDVFPLFGSDAPSSWTAAVMTGLKDKAAEIKMGRLRWVLSTAMPIGSDFKLYLNGRLIRPSKADVPVKKKWVIGKDLKKLAKPGPDEVEATEEKGLPVASRYGLVHPQLGRVTGHMELYADSLTASKEQYGRSHGFFVYVRGRLINLDDPLFGMKALRHGTFVRFRMIAHIDRLDLELRSARESVREGPLQVAAKNFLQGAFNVARTWAEDKEAEKSGGGVTGRIQSTPGSLTRRPIVAAVSAALEKQAKLRMISVPDLADEEKEGFVDALKEHAEGDEGLVVDVRIIDLAQQDPVAVLDASERLLQINGLHPFVASFRHEFSQSFDVLSLVAMSEVLAEAHLHEVGLDQGSIDDIMSRRDEVLRAFARYFKRTAHAVAADLLESGNEQAGLEGSLVEAFDAMGFEAIGIGGPGKPDGTAEAALSGGHEGPRRYAVSLEAKSKQAKGKKVRAEDVLVSRVARHREDYKCDHAVVVGPEFSSKPGSAVMKEIENDRRDTGKTITLLRIKDLALLVRTVSLRAIGLDEIRPLFETCSSPDDSARWVEELAEKRKPAKVDYKAVLKTIWDLQEEDPNESVAFAQVKTALAMGKKKMRISTAEVQETCKSLARFTDQVRVRNNSVELRQRPDQVLKALRAEWSTYPESERGVSFLKFI